MTNRSRITGFLWDLLPYWPPLVFLLSLLAWDMSAGRAWNSSADAALLVVYLFFGTRFWLRTRRSGTREARHDLDAEEIAELVRQVRAAEPVGRD